MPEANNGCAYGHQTRERVASLESKVSTHGQQIKEVADIVERFHNRLPAWATILITFFGLIIGALVGGIVQSLW